MKATVQKVESLKEGEIKLSLTVPREFKHEAMDLLYAEVLLIEPKNAQFRVNELAAIPRVADWLRQAADVLEGIETGSQVPEAPESFEYAPITARMRETLPESTETPISEPEGLELISEPENKTVIICDTGEECLTKAHRDDIKIPTDCFLFNGGECPRVKKTPELSPEQPEECNGKWDSLNPWCKECVADCPDESRIDPEADAGIVEG